MYIDTDKHHTIFRRSQPASDWGHQLSHLQHKSKALERQHDDDPTSSGQDELYPPAKKGKTLPASAAASDQPTRPIPRPLKATHPMTKNTSDVHNVNHRNEKKRPGEVADPENDPKTPVPSKKAKIGSNDSEKSKHIPQALRRTGKPTFFFK